MDRITIISAIIFLQEKGIIDDDDVKKVKEKRMSIDDLCQKALKKYFGICLEETRKKEIEIIDLRSEQDILLEDEIGESNFYKFNPETEALNIFFDVLSNYY